MSAKVPSRVTSVSLLRYVHFGTEYVERNVALCIIFDSGKYEFSKKVINYLARANPRSPRVHCLVVSFGESFDTEDIFAYAWSRKFLDFTILKLNLQRKNQSMVSSYNPFSKLATKSPLTAESVIFPRKLENAYGYPMTIPVKHLPPVLVVKYQNGTQIISGMYSRILRLILETVNFTMNPILMSESVTVKDTMYTVLKDISESRVNMSAIPVSFGKHAKEKLCYSSDVPECVQTIALAPKMKKVVLHVPTNFWLYVFIYPSVIILLSHVAQKLGIINHCDRVKVIQLLLGVATSIKSRENSNRMFYACLMFISFNYANELFPTILSAGWTIGVVKFDGMDDLEQSGLPMYANNLTYQRFFGEGSEYELEKLRHATRKYVDYDCVENSMKGEQMICITTMALLYSNISDWHQDLAHLVIVKLACDPSHFLFEPGSPFVERIDAVQRRMIESGIWSKLLAEKHAKWHFRKTWNDKSSNRSFIGLSHYVVAFGCFVSIVVFSIELSVEKIFLFCK